jgi:hypothetical protein
MSKTFQPWTHILLKINISLIQSTRALPEDHQRPPGGGAPYSLEISAIVYIAEKRR